MHHRSAPTIGGAQILPNGKYRIPDKFSISQRRVRRERLYRCGTGCLRYTLSQPRTNSPGATLNTLAKAKMVESLGSQVLFSRALMFDCERPDLAASSS